MANKTIGSCASCGYPLAASHPGQIETCPMCATVNEAVSQGVTISTPVFVGIIAFFAGIILGPALIASTSEGRAWLEKQARGAIRR